MGKRRKAFWLILVWCLFLGRTVLAQEPHGARLVDMADILEDADERRLLQMLDEISMRHQLDVVIVTTGTLDKKAPREYAEESYDTDEYGFCAAKDGVLMLGSM
ncbi:MAG: TPM domain-containing protein [Lachnospiraceae bacterium]|nr:TPM domain-containing protein [Lachnospiraceae bacterium]